MSDIPSVIWIGKSGKKYRYWIYDYPKKFPDKPGNFMIAKIIGTGWRPVYIGYADDLSQYFETIKDATCIERCFATHVHAHFNPDGESACIKEAIDILDKWGSECQA